MLRTLKNLFKQDREKFVVPKSVQNVIPIKTIWEDGIFLVGRNRFLRVLSIVYLLAAFRFFLFRFLWFWCPAFLLFPYCRQPFFIDKEGKLIYTLRDFPSLTGTFLCSVLVGKKEQVRVGEGAIVTIGATTFILHVPGGEEE